MARNLFIIAGITALATTLGGCGGNPVGVKFHSSVPADQRALIEQDLARLSTMQLPPANPNDLQQLGISQLNASELTAWLAERSGYIIGESFDWKTHVDILAENVSHSPVLLSATALIDPTMTAAVTVMWNLGAYLYLTGLEHSARLGLRLDNRTIAVHTPRVNIVQIGEGLLSATRIADSALDSYANSILRLATYFHEGRHADGHGDHVAFAHARCPSGTYAGLNACERYSNGPYAFNTLLLKAFYQTCHACSPAELETLALHIADYQSRLLPNAQYRDPRPEQIL